MSGIRFCSECLNILHPEEEKNEHRLLFVCKSCDYKEYNQDLTSAEENKIYQRDFMQSFTEAFIDPDYCLDPTMPREKVICPACRNTECAYLTDREPGDKFIRKIYICGRVNKSNRPDCRNIFSPIKYQKITARNETYAYREAGTSTTNILVMLHGNLTSSYIFESVFGKLSENARILAPDMRGFGVSSYAAKLKALNDLAEDLNYFLNELKVTKFVLLGWDLGALVALKYATMFPQYLSKMILVNPVGLKGNTFVDDGEGGLIPEWPEDVMEVASDQRVQEFANALYEKDKEYFKEYFNDQIYTVKLLKQDILDSYIDNFTGQRNFLELIQCMAQLDMNNIDVRVPTLVLAGKRDTKTTVQDAEEIKDILGQYGQIEVFENAGHVIMEDEMERFTELVQEFGFKEEEEEEGMEEEEDTMRE